MKELKHTSHNEAEGQNTTIANHTKLLESGHNSKTSTARESSTHVDVSRRCKPRDFLFMASRGMVSKNVWRTKKSKLEQHNTNAANEILLVASSSFFTSWAISLQHRCLFISSCHVTHCCGKLTHANICQCRGDF